ncbi:MAG: helix-turn-helix domain-containing protein [Verrucomicrobiota bacterium]
MTPESDSAHSSPSRRRSPPHALPTPPGSLEPLLRYLDGLKNRAPLAELTGHLETAAVAPADLLDFMRFDPQRYTRTVIAHGPHYSLLLLCWRSGQRSTIHDHAQSSCAFKVLAGICSETVYRLSPCGQVVPQHTEEFAAGSVVVAEHPKAHQVSNLQAAGQDMVTLHVYTPPLQGLQTFSIMGDGLATDWVGQGDRWLPDETKAMRPPAGPSLADELFEKVVHYMRTHLKHDIHLVDFAKQTGHSAAHFSVLFKNRSGCSPFHYLKELRLREAHRLIVAGQRDVGKIAEAVGYTNRDHFSEVFQAYWGYPVRDLIARVRRAAIDHRP